MQIFHIATVADWEHARRTGTYTTSTLGRTLEQEGFIHAARREQVRGVFERYYQDCGQSLVLLMIDTARLDARWTEERVGDETYPHILGPLNVRAVTSAVPLDARGGTPSLTSMFLKDMAARMGLAVMVMVLVATGLIVGNAVRDGSGAVLGALAGLAVGLALVGVYYRFRRP